MQQNTPYLWIAFSFFFLGKETQPKSPLSLETPPMRAFDIGILGAINYSWFSLAYERKWRKNYVRWNQSKPCQGESENSTAYFCAELLQFQLESLAVLGLFFLDLFQLRLVLLCLLSKGGWTRKTPVGFFHQYFGLHISKSNQSVSSLDSSFCRSYGTKFRLTKCATSYCNTWDFLYRTFCCSSVMLSARTSSIHSGFFTASAVSPSCLTSKVPCIISWK